MAYFVGLDVAKRTTAICVMDDQGRTVEEAIVDTDPKALLGFLRGRGWRYRRVGMEATDIAQWLYGGLAKAGLPIIAVHPTHAHKILSARPNKTDRNDARGLAELMRLGLYRAVHIKSPESRRLRSLLIARDALQQKRRDLEAVLRGLLRGAGIKLGASLRTKFAARVGAATLKHVDLRSVIGPLLKAHAALAEQCEALDRLVRDAARADPICRRLMTAPGVGELTACAFRATVDEPNRFPTSRAVGTHFGLTPRTFQSGESLGRGGVSGWGDATVRRLLFMSAVGVMRTRKRCALVDWAHGLMERKSFSKAAVAVARKLAVVLHQMWVTETDFAWESTRPAS